MNHLHPPDERPARPVQQPQNDGSRPPLERSPHPYFRRANTVRQHGPHPLSPPTSQATSRSESTESGTEADDEKGTILRGLPAPPPRSHKGLRGSTPRGLSPISTPLPTPPATRELSFFETAADKQARDQSAERRKRDAYRQRKKAEVVRRVTETVLLVSIIVTIWNSVGGPHHLTIPAASVGLFTALPVGLYALFPIRQVVFEYKTGKTFSTAVRSGFYIPSRFEPGPLLYPVALPFAIALSLSHQNATYVPVAIICGLSSIPGSMFSSWPDWSAVYTLRWTLTLVPFSETALRMISHTPISSNFMAMSLSREIAILIFPLHRAVHRALGYLSTTSLDPAELELLTTSLIHLLLFAKSPQAIVLKSVLWLGGISIFVSCRRLMEWEVELARVPRWKFARVPHKDAISHRLQRAFSAFMSEPAPTSESSDEDIDQRAKPQPKSLERVKTLAIPATSPKLSLNGFKTAQRRATISDLDPTTIKAERRSHRNRQMQTSPFLTLTMQQANIRKYLYAAIIYILVILIILLPVRHYVGVAGLYGNEPFAWAAGYMFGNVPKFREWVYKLHLTGWIPLPERLTTNDGSFASLQEAFILVSQPANTRLALTIYCLCVVGLGIIIVLKLTNYVEVDTRRKIFHGTMEVMLLPTIFIDPCFFSLALALILALFLLLDLFRASQLPPISRPLTTFLAPYTDGRDHRGPVIVSHIFLLIGCAIPLWLSLAGSDRKGQDPWQGWDVATRDISMISGVVCVGMGDAAASLVGRRYGRTKWYWGGGKSLEGSAAFAVAVIAGLWFSWLWLRLGGWVEWTESWKEMLIAVLKCAVAACGASLMESVLTAANDNVVVPVGLWLLVRGLQI